MNDLVRKLDDESSQSSEEIVKIINQIKEKVLETRIEISQKASQINTAMDEVSATTENNAISSREIGENIESQVVIFEEIAASLSQLTSVANSLKNQTDKFKV